jgi:hypothetical protein
MELTLRLMTRSQLTNRLYQCLSAHIIGIPPYRFSTFYYQLSSALDLQSFSGLSNPLSSPLYYHLINLFP